MQQLEIKKLSHFEQVELLILLLENGKEEPIVNFAKEIENYYETWNSLKKDRGIDVINNETLIDCIVEILSTVGEYALSSLTKLIDIMYYNVNKTKLIGTKGLIELIFHAIKFHPHDVKLQEQVCYVLADLAGIYENRILIRYYKINELIFPVMKFHLSYVNIQRYAFSFLHTMVFFSSYDRMLITKKEKIELIFQIMKLHLYSANIQQNACYFLLYLLRNNNNARILINDQGGIEIILEIMKLHLNCEPVQQIVCLLLIKMMVNNEDKMLIGKKGGIELFFKTMKLYPVNPYIQLNTMEGLKSLAINVENEELINEMGFEV